MKQPPKMLVYRVHTLRPADPVIGMPPGSRGVTPPVVGYQVLTLDARGQTIAGYGWVYERLDQAEAEIRRRKKQWARANCPATDEPKGRRGRALFSRRDGLGNPGGRKPTVRRQPAAK
jgi:hypothetical protein